MKRLDFDYSLKNIPVSNQHALMTKLFDETSKLVNRMRWKAHFYEKGKEENNEEHERKKFDRIFPTRYSAPRSEKLAPFEHNLFDMVKSVTFRRINSGFQNRLKQDLKKINGTSNIIAFADKTSNLYELDPNRYKQLVLDNITKDYSITSDETINVINKEAYEIIEKNEVKGKIPKFETSDAFVTLKDHKPDFPRTIKCRLINPSKTHIAKISKSILENIASDIRKKTGLVQWNNSVEVINWFDGVKGKKAKCFVCFDIVEYYPSIRQQQLRNAIEFAKNYVDIPDSDVKIIWHACNTILSYGKRTWKKKTETDLFDIPMGSFHGAEVCDLVGLYILHRLASLFPSGMYGLYRDDGLAIIDWKPARSLDKLRKGTISAMKDLGFKITIEIGQTRTDFLDVSLDLFNDCYSPFRKPNSTISYIHKESNHPHLVKKSLTGMIEKRINALSKNEQIFNNSKTEYEAALKNAKHRSNLRFNKEKPNDDQNGNEKAEKTKKKARKRRCIFYNPPYCLSVKTNIGRSFLRLLDKHFPKGHEYGKLFNRSKVKISYSCMPNIKGAIQAHNKKIINSLSESKTNDKPCNCRKKQDCPVKNRCQEENVIYEAMVKSDRGEKLYVGSTGRAFKKRWSEHKLSMNDRQYAKTTLAEHVWELKDEDKNTK